MSPVAIPRTPPPGLERAVSRDIARACSTAARASAFAKRDAASAGCSGRSVSSTQGQPGRLLSLGELQDPTQRRALVSGWLRRRAPATAQQRRGQGALQRATQLPPPPAFPPGAGSSSSQRPRRAQGALLREVADEVVRLLPPSSADLRSQDDEALRARTG